MSKIMTYRFDIRLFNCQGTTYAGTSLSPMLNLRAE